MKNLTVLGAGNAARDLVSKIREQDKDCNITLIDKQNYYFSRDDAIVFPGDTKRKIDLREWADSAGIEFINDKVEKINSQRRKIYLKQNQAREFQNLVVATGIVSKKMTIKGEHREGFFYLSDIDSLKLRDLLRVTSEVCIYVSTWLGLRLALSLVSLGKKIKIVSYSLDFLGQEKSRVIELLKEKNIDIYLNSFIQEVVGEGMIKAVKISPLKVFSSQMVFIDSGFVANLSFFEEPLQLRNTIFTGQEDIYLLGDVNFPNIENQVLFSSTQKRAERQAGVLAEFLLKGVKPDLSGIEVEENSLVANIDKILRPAEGGAQY